ncbi:MAG: YajQ family cyclic di-GMP-binding protein, partial [Legionellaceae bacterium]|nr:YajQ family cyclic di-GMP-binding protein [Legionellaceae bacterium]
MPSFDVVSKTDTHELNNAVDQANREVTTRFDFKGTNASYKFENEQIVM